MYVPTDGLVISLPFDIWVVIRWDGQSKKKRKKKRIVLNAISIVILGPSINISRLGYLDWQ
jgi:hypothetical protein